MSTEQLHDDESYHSITYSAGSSGETMPHVKCCNGHETGETHLSSPIKKKKNKLNYTPKICLLVIKVACFTTVKTVGYTKNEKWINNKHWPLMEHFRRLSGQCSRNICQLWEPIQPQMVAKYKGD